MVRFFVTTLAILLFPAVVFAFETTDIEALFGATNVVATAGNGGLTVGVSKDGDVTVLSYPSPSYVDQLYYASGNGDARTEPLQGASERMGTFAGIAAQTADGISQSWLRTWERTVTYARTDATVILTTFQNDTLGLTVEQYDFVAPERDVFFRRFEVTRSPDSPVTQAWVTGYANLQPSVSKIEQFPVSDFALDHYVDFLGLWDAANSAVLQFHPGDTNRYEAPLSILNRQDRDFGPLGSLLTSVTTDPVRLSQLAATVDDDYAAGSYTYFSSSPLPDQYQVGVDSSNFCGTIDSLVDTVIVEANKPDNDELPIDPMALDALRCQSYDPVETPYDTNNWMARPLDAFDDAEDGELSGERLAGAQVNSAIRVPLSFEQGRAVATLHYAFGETASDARTALQWARSADSDAIRTDVFDTDAAWASDLQIPEEVSAQMHDFIVRAFLNMRVGTDRQTGAIVASIARQPSYQVDWPRDGAFFNVALDLAGKHELVEKRARFYADTIRTQKAPIVPFLNQPVPGWPNDPNERAFPPGSWEMNYYADGTVGGVIRLEIDNTALVLWSIINHAGFIDDVDARRAYLRENWEMIEAAANFLETWRDPETGLIWPANEDDHIEYTQGLQGCGTAYLGLVAAAQTAAFLDEPARAQAWAYRAGELRSAILHYLYDEEVGFVGQPSGEVGPVGGVTAWIGWPIRVVDYDDPRLREQLRVFLDRELSEVRGETRIGSYPTKAATSVALAFQGEPEAELAYEIAETLATEIANPNTLSIGEAWVNDDVDGDGEFDRYVSTQAPPHLWSAILVYITVVAYWEPERFDAWRGRLGDIEIPTVAAPGTPQPEPDAGMSDAGGMDGGSGGRTDAAEPSGDLGGSSGCGCVQGHSDAPFVWPLALVLLLGLRRTRAVRARRWRPGSTGR